MRRWSRGLSGQKHPEREEQRPASQLGRHQRVHHAHLQVKLLGSGGCDTSVNENECVCVGDCEAVFLYFNRYQQYPRLKPDKKGHLEKVLTKESYCRKVLRVLLTFDLS